MGTSQLHAFFYKEMVYKEILLDWQKPKKNQESFSTSSKNLRKFSRNFLIKNKKLRKS